MVVDVSVIMLAIGTYYIMLLSAMIAMRMWSIIGNKLAIVKGNLHNRQ